MAKTKKEVVENTTKEQVVETTQNKPKESIPKVELSKFKSKDDSNVIKVDLSKPPKTEENADTKQETTDVVSGEQAPVVEEVVEEIPQGETTVQNEETPVVEEITEEEAKEIETTKEEVVKAVEEAETTGKPLPEGVEKLMQFMEETGGDLQDYVKLNRDISSLDDQDILYEYYKETKPHLTNEEINFLMEDQFSYEEGTDDEREIKRKKLALKEQVASARSHLDGQKSKYYEEIKAGSKLTSEQQKAIDFFNRYNKESEQAKKAADNSKSSFLKKTNEVFNNKFKGFEYKVGEKRYRFNVKDVDKIKDTQSDINNFVGKFLDENKQMSDAKGYHKGLFTAMNADAIAKHFYDQGKSDAIKDTVAKAKNINVNPRQSHNQVDSGGIKVRVLGESTSDFKFKIKKKN